MLRDLHMQFIPFPYRMLVDGIWRLATDPNHLRLESKFYDYHLHHSSFLWYYDKLSLDVSMFRCVQNKLWDTFCVCVIQYL